MGNNSTVGQSLSDLPDSHEQQSLLERVASSRGFAGSATLKSFLIYVTEHAIAGRLEAIKEQQIGANVLGRKHDYDPAQDNIVRVRARQVRQKLDEYFEGDGREEPVTISIPKGHYVPVFSARIPSVTIEIPARKTAHPSQPAPVNEQANREHEALLETRRRGRSARFRAGLPWAVALAAIIVAAVAIVARPENRNAAAPDQSHSAMGRNLWSQFFPAKGQELTLVLADAGFALWQDMMHRNLTLGDYVSGHYLTERLPNPETREIAIRRSTSPADLSVSLRVSDIAHAYGGVMKVQFARSVDIHELQRGNVVIIGSRRSNPWVELFEPQMNFVLDYDAGVQGPCFRNKSPLAGEAKTFAIPGTLAIQTEQSGAVSSYAVVAMLPSSSGPGRVLVLEGLNMEGTDAAGEFVTNPKHFNTLLHRIGLNNDGPLKPFEALLKLTSVAGGYSDIQLIAYRYGRR